MMANRRQWVYGAALILGVSVPLGVITPWLSAHGLNVSLLFDELFDTGVSSFFAADVILAVTTLLTVAALDDGLPRRSRIAVAMASLLGASVGLPTYLFFRERAMTQRALGG